MIALGGRNEMSGGRINFVGKLYTELWPGV